MAKLKAKHLFELIYPSDPVLSPDASHVALVQTVVETREDKPPRYRSAIYSYPVAGGEPRQLTRGPLADTQPRFSPDGSKLAYLSRRSEEGKPQLYLLDFAGGEPEALTDLPAGVSEVCWHPSGERIAFVSRGDYQPPKDDERVMRVIERQWFRADGQGFRAEVPAQVYGLELSSREPRQLTELEHDPSGLAFAPDGRTLYFAAAPSEAEEERWRAQLYALRLKSGKLKALLEAPMPASALSPSPDGEQLAFFAPRDPENVSSGPGLWLLSAEGGKPTPVPGNWDTTPSVGGDSRYGSYPNRAAWSASGQALVLNVNREGRSGLALLEPSGELTPIVGGERAVTGFDYRAGVAAFTAETPSRPGELFVFAGGEERRLSALNDALAERFAFREASPAQTLETDDGARLAYWTLPPQKPRRDKALVVEVHGGPHTNYGYGFSFEFQLLAAAGYTVVYGNPRGSSSYGSDFAGALLGRYGTVDADDVLAITEHALERHADPDAPVHLTGGSYGGFMTNWLVGHSDRFRSAVTQRSICNWLSFYGTSDIGPRFSELEQGGTPWADLEKLWEQSPIRYVERVTTPLLILHAEADYRCPIEQAEQLFTALKRLGKAPTKLVRFPGEGHELSRSGRPDRRVARLEMILSWFEGHA